MTKSGGPPEEGFETTTKRGGKGKRKDSDSDLEDHEVDVPLYLGLSLHGEDKLNTKLREMILAQVEKLVEFNQSSMLE